MEGLADIGGGIVENYVLAFALEPSAVFFALGDYFGDERGLVSV